jgi:hypothetical protein
MPDTRFKDDETFPLSTILVCVDIDDLTDTENGLNPRLTLYKSYKVLNEPKFQIWTGIEIKHDCDNYSSFYHPNRFLTLEEYRKHKIDNYLKS